MKRGGGIDRKGELPPAGGKATIEGADLRPFDASQGFFDSLCGAVVISTAPQSFSFCFSGSELDFQAFLAGELAA